MPKKVTVGQICWLSGGFTDDLSGRLVKVVKIGDKKTYKNIDVDFVNPQETDEYFTHNGLFGVYSSEYLFTSPDDYHEGFCEGSKDDISILTTQSKYRRKCVSCGSNLTNKARFCQECGTPCTMK